MEILMGRIKSQFSNKFFIRSLPNPQFYPFSRVLASFFTTKTRAKSSPFTSMEDSLLYKQIAIIKDPKASVIPVLDRWIREGNTVEQHQLQSLVWHIKQFRRFYHALEISYWMSDSRYFKISPIDVAVRLDLIQRVFGAERAETYFQNLSNKLKTFNVYGALLSCYARENSVQKAEALMQEMKEKGMATSSFPYNMMIILYTKSGEFRKIGTLIQDMEGNQIPQDKYTMANLMTAYVASSNFSGMEKILNQMRENPSLSQGWRMYSRAAIGYLKAGSIEKSLEMLIEMEKRIPFRANGNTMPFNFLLTQYAETGKKDELYRVWNKYKPLIQQKNTTFCCMIVSLSRVGDIEGAEKIFDEWESESDCTHYDFRVLNRLIVAYCKNGMVEKAEAAVEKAAEGRTPYASTWNILAHGYLEQNQMDKGVEMLKRAISVSRKSWRPSLTVLRACLDYMEAEGDVEGMEELVKSLKGGEVCVRDLYHRLVRTHAAAGKSFEVHDWMKKDDFPATEQT